MAKSIDEMTLFEKAEAAFQQVVVTVVKTARDTNTPIVLWENGQVCEISADEYEARQRQIAGEIPDPEADGGDSEPTAGEADHRGG